MCSGRWTPRVKAVLRKTIAVTRISEVETKHLDISLISCWCSCWPHSRRSQQAGHPKARFKGQSMLEKVLDTMIIADPTL